MESKFETNSLVVADIKELLHSFNLPSIPVYTEDTVLYDGRTYIKGNKIVKYTNGNFIELQPYKYGTEIINLTKNFLIRSTIYDSYTHNYLGNYLRFLRDYRNINLMGLYNCCYEDRLVNTTSTIDINANSTFYIDTDDGVNNYILVPIKLNSYYTIAINSCAAYELACILYNDAYVSTDESKNLSAATYKKINGSKFTNPYLLSTYFSNAESFWRKENDIRLLIKLPKKVQTSIVVLEGNWLDSASVIDGRLTSTACYDDSSKYTQTLLSKNSLLKCNNLTIYPFADRLVEYITGNVITPLDKIGEDISRAQEDFYKQRLGYIKGAYGIWSDSFRNDLYKEALKPDITKGHKRYTNSIITYRDGEESQEKYRYRFIDLYDNLTGYIDKDVETLTLTDLTKARERGDYDE